MPVDLDIDAVYWMAKYTGEKFLSCYITKSLEF